MKIIIIFLALSSLIFKNIYTASVFTFSPSLEQKSLIKVAINVWSHPSIKLKMKDENILSHEFFADYDNSEFPIIPRDIKINVFNIIENLELTMRIKNQLFYIIEPIGNEIIHYLSLTVGKLNKINKQLHPKFNDYVDNIQWTSFGRIDETKTLMAVFDSIVDKNLPYEEINYMYLLTEACKCFHADGIKKIWSILTDEDKKIIKSSIKNRYLSLIADKYYLDEYTRHMILYWLIRLQIVNNPGYDSNNMLSYTRGILNKYFNWCINRNDGSLKFFLLKSSPSFIGNEKDNFIIERLEHLGDDFFYDVVPCHNIIFLMQQLSEVTRLNYVKNNREILLNKLINSWPWRYNYFELFEEIIKNENPPTSISHQNLLEKIINRITTELSKLKNHKQISLWMIGQFWLSYKQYFSEGFIKTCLSLNIDYIDKLRILTAIIREWEIKNTNDIISIDDITNLGIVINSLRHYDLLYDICELILKTSNERYKLMEPIDIQFFLINFIINGDRYDEADSLIHWKFKGNDKKKENYRTSINWILIIKKIQLEQKNYDSIGSINRKLHLLIDWLNFTDDQRNKLKTCINNQFNNEINTVDWNSFYVCIKKPEFILKRKPNCTSKKESVAKRPKNK